MIKQLKNHVGLCIKLLLNTSENASSSIFSGSDNIANLNQIRTNTMALVQAGIESDEAITGVPALCLTYTGVQENRDVETTTSGDFILTDRYINFNFPSNTPNYLYRYKVGTKDVRVHATTSPETNLNILARGGTIYSAFLELDYSTLLANTSVTNLSAFTVGFDENQEQAFKSSMLYCSTPKFKYYAFYPHGVVSTGSAGFVTEDFTP